MRRARDDEEYPTPEYAVELALDAAPRKCQDGLIQDLIAPSRLLKLSTCDSFQTSYDPNSFRMVLQLRGRNIGGIIKPLAMLTVWSFFIAAVLEFMPSSFTDTIRRFSEPLQQVTQSRQQARRAVRAAGVATCVRLTRAGAASRRPRSPPPLASCWSIG